MPPPYVLLHLFIIACLFILLKIIHCFQLHQQAILNAKPFVFHCHFNFHCHFCLAFVPWCVCCLSCNFVCVCFATMKLCQLFYFQICCFFHYYCFLFECLQPTFSAVLLWLACPCNFCSLFPAVNCMYNINFAFMFKADTYATWLKIILLVFQSPELMYGIAAKLATSKANF